MSEKRFRTNDLVKFNYSEIGEYVDENHTDKPLRNDEVVDLLNEQQATIKYLNMEIEENADLIGKQQATIRKLQDLCGESDGENAKLRQEIKELKAQLREKEQDERLYANEIVKLNKEAKEVLDFKSLGGDY